MSADTVSLNNSGTIRAATAYFSLGSVATSQDLITNSGLIVGDVLLGKADDLYSGAAGRIVGTIKAGDGADVLLGGALGEYFIGDAGIDYLNGGGGNDSLDGGTENDTLIGGIGLDKLIGGGGNDRLFGGLSNDTLTGGLNNDVFVFDSKPNAASNRDVITDFNHVADTIQLENAIFTKLGAGVHALNPVFFRVGAAAADANDYIVYNRATGILSYDNDGNGSHAAIAFAVLTNKPVLAANDFLVI
jgi:serralysin